MDMTSKLACSIPGAPKDVGAGWPHDRRAGVLGDHQPVKVDPALLVGKRQVGLNKKRRTVHMQRAIDGNRPPRRERYWMPAISGITMGINTRAAHGASKAGH